MFVILRKDDAIPAGLLIFLSYYKAVHTEARARFHNVPTASIVNSITGHGYLQEGTMVDGVRLQK